MKNVTRSMILALATLTSCSHSNEKTSTHQGASRGKKIFSAEPSHDQKPQVIRFKESTKCTYLVTNDYFSNNIINVIGISKFGLKNMFKSKYKISFETAKNMYDSTYTDTLYTIYKGKSWLEIKGFNIKRPAASVPMWIEADISDDSVMLFKNVSIGMTKDKFMKIIGAKNSSCDTIKVDTEEQSCNNYFIFKNNFLRRILLTSGVE